MESQPFEKQMFSTNRKEKIFNVRKVAYKQFQNEKYLKSNFSPFQKKQHQREPASTQPKKGDFLALTVTSGPYKEMNKKYQNLKQDLAGQKQRRLQKLKEREEELSKYKCENDRLEQENRKLNQRKDEIKAKIEELRGRNEVMRQEQMQRNEEIRMMNMEYLKNMIMGMRYQNGIQIDTDHMTYEQLLELEEKMGHVSKGITEEQFTQLKRIDAKNVEEVCSICYYNVKEGEQINQLPCKHCFHVDCIKEWLLKEKICPLCKQQIFGKQQSQQGLQGQVQKK